VAFHLKYDGFRALCYLEQGRCWLISRNGNLMSRFTGLSEPDCSRTRCGRRNFRR
jgi:ATP-dependent DNA ligase